MAENFGRMSTNEKIARLVEWEAAVKVEERLVALANMQTRYRVGVSISRRESSIHMNPLYTMDPAWSVMLQTSSITVLLDALDDVRKQCPDGGSRMEDPEGGVMWVGRVTADG